MTTNPPRDDAPNPLKMGGWGPMESDPKSVCNWWLPPQHPLAVICKAETEEAAQAIADALNGRADTPARAGMVKPLVWASDLHGRWIGEPPVKLGTLAFWVFGTPSGGFERHTESGKQLYPTLEAAKAAAQADYAARILAALLPTEAGAIPKMICRNCGADLSVVRVAACCSDPKPDSLGSVPPAAPTDTALVEVLPLVWKDGTFYDDDEGPIYSEAVGAGYTYIAEAVDCTLAEAKVKAQAEYEANIRASLASRAAPTEAQVTVGEDKAASALVPVFEKLHREWAVSKGRDPEKYMSQFSTTATALRALAGGES